MFSHDQLEEFRKQAAVEAVQQAVKTAQDLAKAAGLKIGRIASISYGPRSPQPRYVMKSGGRAAATPVEVGQIAVEASVNVVFEAN